MPELAYHDLHEADSYYLSAPKQVSPKRRSGFTPPTPKPCPSCFRPLHTRGYCESCEASGAAARHREARA